MTIIDLIFGILCVILGFELCKLYYEVIEEDDYTEEIENESHSSEHFFNYDLSKQDFVITGDRHADTIEKSFNNNEVKHPNESWKYTFENGESINSNRPLSYDELKPFVDENGPVKDDGLEVIKI